VLQEIQVCEVAHPDQASTEFPLSHPRCYVGQSLKILMIHERLVPRPVEEIPPPLRAVLRRAMRPKFRA
jgi:hypothetical protein